MAAGPTPTQHARPLRHGTHGHTRPTMEAGHALAQHARPWRRAQHQHNTPYRDDGQRTGTARPAMAAGRATAQRARPYGRAGQQHRAQEDKWMAHNTRSGGKPVRPGPTRPEQPKPNPNGGPRPNTPDTWTSRPLGGEDDGKPTKPAMHSTGDNTTPQTQTLRPQARHSKTHPRRHKPCGRRPTTTQHSRPSLSGPQRNPAQADRQRLKGRQTNTTR